MYILSRVFVKGGCPLAQAMHASVYIRVVLAIVFTNRVDYFSGLLGGRAIIQVDQWVAINFPA
jgi:hypothetical protein